MDLFMGQTLGDRYELIELIGEGGMALVYKANDLLLNRVVAVKVLRPQYAVDSEFVERFRREAQAAASLSHPNVVNIYDVGQDRDIHFIVMEYVQGKNLKSLIHQADNPFPVDYVVGVGIQICRALEHAHTKNVVHRDIKPHNILITEDGVVKVTDFGIARAVSSSTLTQTGTIMGSVHYFSPEQAKGASIGPQSDLYSLGIVLFELLTGRVPYTGESPIAVALKHAQEEVPTVRKDNPSVPVFLDRVIQQAMAKDLTGRYHSALEVRQDLERVRWNKIDRSERASLTDELEETKIIRRASTVTEEEKEVAKSGSAWKKIILALVFVGLIGVTFVFVVFPSFFNVEEVMVPRVIGLSLSDADKALSRVGLSYDVIRKINDSQVPRDHIVDQEPRPNRWIKVSRKVKLTVSLGAELASVPDVIGLTPREARVAASEVGLDIGNQLQDFSSEIPEGRIMLQDPPPFARVEKGSQVTITISKGAAPDIVVVPDFVGLPYEQALRELRSVGLVPGRVIEDPRAGNGVLPGMVVDQNPPPGVSLTPGSSVDFVVSPASSPGPTEPEGPIPGPEPNLPTIPQQPSDEPWTEEPPAQVPEDGEELPSEPPAQPNPEPLPVPEGQPSAPQPEVPTESPLRNVKRAEVQILVPPGPVKQLVQIIVIDSYPAREVYSKVHNPGDRVVQVVEGYGNSVRMQVYIDGVMYKEQSFQD